MRVTIIVFVALVGIILSAIPTPALAQYCRCECYRLPGGRVCRRVCSYPRYVPPPEPSSPRYVQSYGAYSAPSYRPVTDPIPPELLALLAAVGVAFLVAATIGAALSSTGTAVAEVDRDTETTNQITAELDAAVRKADAHIAAALARIRDGDRHGR
jgi:hypothetical protein